MALFNLDEKLQPVGRICKDSNNRHHRRTQGYIRGDCARGDSFGSGGHAELLSRPEMMDHPNGLKAVEPTIKAIEKCRELGIQIIWLNWGVTDEDLSIMPAAVQRGFMNDTILELSPERRRYIGLGSDLGDGKGRVLFAGSWNADIYPLLKAHIKPNDLHCAKNRMSGLWSPEQPLWKTLKAENKNSLLFAGVNTDQCVLGTFVDGYNAGWNCILVDDCCGTTTVGAKEVTFYNISTSYGFVTDSASLLDCKVG